ncbi:c-type cytochrome [Pararhizobium mangrovi]|uniref:C-type cytochrome n=1 Tax=Pararhizobium mangrovi TaxID=2590452 RepID=A0A506U1Q2_9HYPH|nr:c-type cytochrome [Pararhizobium mangrovi]TPW25777.1 c-type cytochrome [Pararhizobium mangrovi]
MNSAFLNMAAGAFLGTCFVAMSLSILSGAIYDSPTPAKEGFVIKAAVPEGGGSSQSQKPEVPPIAPLLASADPAEGKSIFKKCQTCHNGEKGGPNKIGPNLWGVVGRPIASHEGFSYSSGMKDFSDGGKEHWTYDHLNHFIHDPQGVVKGTAMTFAGVKDDQQRADVIAYLHTLSDDPVPFPKPDEGKKEGKDSASSGDGGDAKAGNGDAGNAKAKASEGADSQNADSGPKGASGTGNATDENGASAAGDNGAGDGGSGSGSGSGNASGDTNGNASGSTGGNAGSNTNDSNAGGSGDKGSNAADSGKANSGDAGSAGQSEPNGVTNSDQSSEPRTLSPSDQPATTDDPNAGSQSQTQKSNEQSGQKVPDDAQ